MKVPRLPLLFLLFSLNISALHAQLVNIESQRMQTDSVRFAGNANLTFNHQRANDVSLSVFHASLNTQLKSKNLKNVFLILGDYASSKSNSNTLANTAFGHFRYNYKINSWIRWEAYSQVQLNELLSLRYRFLTGTGARFKIMKGDIFKAYLGISAFYEDERVEDVLQTRSQDVRMSNYLSFSVKFPKDRGELASTTYYQPLVRNFSDYRITTQSMLQLNITKHISFITAVNYFFDYNPPIGVKPSTFSIQNGLKIQF